MSDHEQNLRALLEGLHISKSDIEWMMKSGGPGLFRGIGRDFMKSDVKRIVAEGKFADPGRPNPLKPRT